MHMHLWKIQICPIVVFYKDLMDKYIKDYTSYDILCRQTKLSLQQGNTMYILHEKVMQVK